MSAQHDHGLAEAARHGIARSGEWPRVERTHLAAHPACACCDRADVGVQVHHVFPFHYCVALGRPDLELDDRNLVTLCETETGRPAEDHHLLVGHLGSFQSSNLNVLYDAARYRKMTAAAIRADPRWLASVEDRLKPLGEMTEDDKKVFASRMNARFPKP